MELVEVLVVVVVRLMHVFIEGIMGIIGMTTGRREETGCLGEYYEHLTGGVTSLTCHLGLGFCNRSIGSLINEKVGNPMGDGRAEIIHKLILVNRDNLLLAFEYKLVNKLTEVLSFRDTHCWTETVESLRTRRLHFQSPA